MNEQKCNAKCRQKSYYYGVRYTAEMQYLRTNSIVNKQKQ